MTICETSKSYLVQRVKKNNTYLKQTKVPSITDGCAVKPKTSLLEDVWSSIENLPTPQQDQALSLIQKIKKIPNLTINQHFEMVYQDGPQCGMNIIQLLLNNVGYQQPRKILPG